MPKNTLLIPTSSKKTRVETHEIKRLPWKNNQWQQVYADGVTNPDELLSILGLINSHLAEEVDLHQPFAMKVPRAFVKKMRVGDPADPLLRQVLPIQTERITDEAFLQDPLVEKASLVGPGLIYKYQSRVLVVPTGSCAIHCRYCFRRHFPYSEQQAMGDGWQSLTDFLVHHPQVNEVILSGGDPLSLSTRRLSTLTDLLDDFPQIIRLRIHTRLPIVLPERIDGAFLNWVSQSRQSVIMVVHCNHSQELGESFAQASSALKAHGVWLLNQSVLLKDVNDTVDVLCELSEQLFTMGVLPYYLHQLDSVQGASHFQVPMATGQRLLGGMLTRLPGFLVPKLVVEQAGEPSKTWLSPL